MSKEEIVMIPKGGVRAGAGRKPKDPKDRLERPLRVMLRPGDYERIKTMAKEKGGGVSGLARQWILMGLDGES